MNSDRPSVGGRYVQGHKKDLGGRGCSCCDKIGIKVGGGCTSWPDKDLRASQRMINGNRCIPKATKGLMVGKGDFLASKKTFG